MVAANQKWSVDGQYRFITRLTLRKLRNKKEDVWEVNVKKT